MADMTMTLTVENSSMRAKKTEGFFYGLVKC